jgi:hypothetical protein
MKLPAAARISTAAIKLNLQRYREEEIALLDLGLSYISAPENRDLGIVKSIRKPFKKLIIDPFPVRINREGQFFFELFLSTLYRLMQPNQLSDRLFQLSPWDDFIDEAFLEGVFGGLEIVREFFAEGLFDDASAGKADRRFGFSENDIAQHGKTSNYAASGGMSQNW